MSSAVQEGTVRILDLQASYSRNLDVAIKRLKPLEPIRELPRSLTKVKFNWPIAQADHKIQILSSAHGLLLNFDQLLLKNLSCDLLLTIFSYVKMFLYTFGCNWLTTSLLSFVACISLCSIFSELWSLGFYICISSGGFNLLESDFEFVKPQPKNMTIGMSLVCNGNAPTHRKIQKIENVERLILADDELNNTEKSRTTKTVGDRYLELEASFIALAKVLEFEREKSSQDQIMFMKTLSDLHSFHGNKQSNLEAIIAELQRELQVEKLRTSEQTDFIQTLTLASSEAKNRLQILQLQLSDIETEVNKSKMSFEKDLLEPQANFLKDEELKRIPIISLSNSKLQEECNRLKADLLETKSQLEQALHDNQLLLCKIELSKCDVEHTDS